MRRYRGSDKPPGPTLSPPPYSRRTSASTNPRSRGPTTGKTSPVSAYSISERDIMMVQGSGTASVFLDPRTKMPIIPPAGRSIPKLRMADLTSSLAPLVDSQIIPEPETPSLGEKRMTSFKRGGPAKDMLSSFDDAVRVPDMRMINSKVAQLKKATYTGSSGRDTRAHVASKSIGFGSGPTHKSKSSGKSEEQNMRKLMGQLKDKYLQDMESQLGLAMDRKPRPSIPQSSKIAQYESENDEIEVEIPRPTTNAAEISSRIDKVVREWATESQKLNKQEVRNSNLKGRQQQKLNAMAISNKSPPESPQTSKGTSKRNNDHKASPSPQAGAGVEGKNKNLAKISNAFRKSLDPITKRDVRELIKVPENDLDDLIDEHEQRRKAHESVFKNAITTAPVPVGNADPKKNEQKNSPAAKTNPTTGEERNLKPQSTLDVEKRNRSTPAVPVHPKLKPFAEALGVAKDDDKEMYKIIKEHMAYEMASGPPKITSTSVTRKRSTTTSSSNMLRGDAAGKVLQKYGDSHKKLQGIVDSFTLKVDSPRKRYGPEANLTSDTSDEGEIGTGKIVVSSPASKFQSKSTLNARRHNATAANSTMSKSLKTIDRASTVAQRLGTLMSRVALRNEKYDYEKQQEAQQKAISAGPDRLEPTPSSSLGKASIRQQSDPSTLREAELPPNPYESSSGPSQRPSIPLGVSKIESVQFDKYVDEMRKVAQKAAQSFEKFKELKHGEGELPSFSENESDSGGESDEEAFATATAAAEIAALQEEKRKSAQALLAAGAEKQERKQQNSINPGRIHNSTKNGKVDTGSGSSPREIGTSALANNRFVNTSATREVGGGGSVAHQSRGVEDQDKNNNADFKFVPELSYTDQLLLQKLRKMREKEGWGDLPEVEIPADIPDKSDIELMRKRVDMDFPKETERASLGPVSLNAILRARLTK